MWLFYKDARLSVSAFLGDHCACLITTRVYLIEKERPKAVVEDQLGRSHVRRGHAFVPT